ncbi:MAG: hypothetical protein J7L89_01615 [Bacteroidales bacterium]|nr:hypothetical protein [Bacteroidales bacterium]
MEIPKNQVATRPIAEFNYEVTPLYRGYTDKILYINVSDYSFKIRDVPVEMKEKFIGGKGYGLKLLWDATKPDTRWNDPENELVISCGPIGGITQYSGTGKSLVVTLSPASGSVTDSNAGGYFGPFVKFSGFDSIEIQGKSDRDVLIVIDGTKGKVTIEEAPEEPKDSHLLADMLTEKYADDERDKINVSVVSSGQAAEHSWLGMMNFSFFDRKKGKVRLKQAGRGGTGTVLRDKKIKALVCKIPGVKGNLNNVVDMNAIIERGKNFNREMRELDESQSEMRTKGTAHLMEIMNDYDLLPVMNYKFGAHDESPKIDSEVWKSLFQQGTPDGCWIGCTMSCSKAVNPYIVRTGPYKGQEVIADGPEYENAAGLGSNCGIFDPYYIIEANFYCDTYGMDTISWGTLVAFVMECYENGILNKERTGGLDLHFGNADAAIELLHQVARGEGFGLIAGKGVRKMKEIFEKEYGADPQFLFDIGMENKGLEYSEYVSKESLAQQGGFAMTNKGPQHDEAWLIFMDMVNNQIPTFEDKAEALHYFPMFRTWFALVGLCKLPWNDVEPANNSETDEPAKVPEHVDNYVTIYKAVTGREFDNKKLVEDSERVYNFQRIFNLRRGFGTRRWDAQPFRAAGPVTLEEYESRMERYDKQLKELVGLDPEKMTLEERHRALRKFREEQYEKLLDAVYLRRGWNNNGVPKIEFLKKIGMDLPEVLEVVKLYQ